MALVLKDRVRETTSTTGTGALTLAGASATFDTFASVMSTNDTTYYAIVHSGGADEWEVGLGTYSGTNTLTRTTVLSSSNSGSATNFSAGSKFVFITLPASVAAHLDPASGDHDLASIITLGNHDTDNLSEGSSNLYYTNARVDARIAANPSGDPAGTAVAMAIALG